MMEIDSFLDKYVMYLTIGFVIRIVVTFILFFRHDKYYGIAVLFADAALFIVAATWGQSLIFDAMVRFSELQANVSSGGSGPPFEMGILGLVAGGLLSAIFMAMKFGLEVATIKHKASPRHGPQSP